MRPRHVVALVPVLALLAAPFVANRTEPYVLGLPFLLFWIVLWVVLTAATMALVRHLDDRAGAE